MCNFGLSIAVGLLFGAAGASDDEGKPNLSGKWKIDEARTEPGPASKDLVLVVERKGQDIRIEETRGPNPKEDVSDFTCGTMGKECSMQDGGEQAKVSLYYSGPVLVVLKTQGRKSDAVEKRRISLSPEGDSLTVEITHIDPEGKAEKLVFSKSK